MLPDHIFSTFQTASRGLSVQREKLSAASRNIANANTSVPRGSGHIYRPQSVNTFAPRPIDFRQVLQESVTSLKRTHPKHFAASSHAPVSSLPEQQYLGPAYEVTEKNEFRYEYDPNHPDADENGMVRYPDIDLIREMTQMVSANRLYEANLSSIEAEKQMIRRSLEI